MGESSIDRKGRSDYLLHTYNLCTSSCYQYVFGICENRAIFFDHLHQISINNKSEPKKKGGVCHFLQFVFYCYATQFTVKKERAKMNDERISRNVNNNVST